MAPDLKKGRIYFYYSPLRNASADDVGNTLTTCDHMFEDYLNKEQTAREKEDSTFIYHHLHILSIERMKEFFYRIFRDRMTLVEEQ